VLLVAYLGMRPLSISSTYNLLTLCEDFVRIVLVGRVGFDALHRLFHDGRVQDGHEPCLNAPKRFPFFPWIAMQSRTPISLLLLLHWEFRGLSTGAQKVVDPLFGNKANYLQSGI
jgi:hypothetical protein